MARALNLTGMVFGRLTALSQEGEVVQSGTRFRLWRCLCQCGQETLATTGSLTGGSTRSCGCLKPGPRPKPFLSRLDKTAKPDCHLWTGKVDVYGYGRLSVDGKEVIASRHAWLLHHGTSPGDLCVLHHCDTPSCCNPAHLFLGTRTDNAADKVAKGRAKGPKSVFRPRAKLTLEQVRAIRADPRSALSAAPEYGVSQTAILDIRSGKTWGDLA